jgi:hypothetical protein
MDDIRKPVDFDLFAPHNEAVDLVGDFSGWKPVAMQRGDDGWCRALVDLADGDHQTLERRGQRRRGGGQYLRHAEAGEFAIEGRGLEDHE